MWIELLCVATAAPFAMVILGALRGLRGLRELPAFDQRPTARVAVVLPVSNGGAGFEATLERLLGQRGVDLTLVVVDDRSDDATPERIAAAAARDPRVRPVRVDALPAGWLGKCHACDQGVRAVGPEADWLLFLDDDSWLEPLTIARAVAEAERCGVDHLCLIPELRGLSASGAIAAVPMCLALMGKVDAVARGADAMGVGAFTLVRRGVYARVGGHAGLRLAVVEDVELARRIRRAGGRSALRFAIRLFSVEWITSLPGAFGVLKKNFFAVLGCRTSPVVLVAGAIFAAYALSLVLPWASAAALRWLPLLALLAQAVPGVWVARRYGWRGGRGLWAPVGLPLVAAMMLHSVVHVWRQGGVVWRGVFYPLRELRAFAREF